MTDPLPVPFLSIYSPLLTANPTNQVHDVGPAGGRLLTAYSPTPMHAVHLRGFLSFWQTLHFVDENPAKPISPSILAPGHVITIEPGLYVCVSSCSLGSTLSLFPCPSLPPCPSN